MPVLGHRLQVLIDDERLQRLEQRAKSTGASVGSLVREAIDIAYPGAQTDRERAAASFLAAEPIEVGDWADIKAELTAVREPPT